MGSHVRPSLENIVMLNRDSYLVNVTGEDAAYVVGYSADIRGMNVSTTLARFPKDEIALRLQVREDLKPQGDELQYSHRKADNS